MIEITIIITLLCFNVLSYSYINTKNNSLSKQLQKEKELKNQAKEKSERKTLQFDTDKKKLMNMIRELQHQNTNYQELFLRTEQFKEGMLVLNKKVRAQRDLAVKQKDIAVESSRKLAKKYAAMQKIKKAD